MNDQAAVAAQLERPLRAPVEVVSRCHLEVPVVVAVPPVLDDGTPFPTRYWLSCPLARSRVGRLEAAGGVRAMDRRASADPAFGARLQASHRRYATERDALVPPSAPLRPGGGVGGGATVKCLHAHYADHAAGHDNPVGEVVAPWVEPLDCSVACVAARSDGSVGLNPLWREPR